MVGHNVILDLSSRLLKLRCRQHINDRIKAHIYLKQQRFDILCKELRKKLTPFDYESGSDVLSFFRIPEGIRILGYNVYASKNFG